MYKANLSYEQVNYYLTDLLNNDLLSQHILENGVVFRTSEKGQGIFKTLYPTYGLGQGERKGKSKTSTCTNRKKQGGELYFSILTQQVQL